MKPVMLDMVIQLSVGQGGHHGIMAIRQHGQREHKFAFEVRSRPDGQRVPIGIWQGIFTKEILSQAITHQKPKYGPIHVLMRDRANPQT